MLKCYRQCSSTGVANAIPLHQGRQSPAGASATAAAAVPTVEFCEAVVLPQCRRKGSSAIVPKVIALQQRRQSLVPPCATAGAYVR